MSENKVLKIRELVARKISENKEIIEHNKKEKQRLTMENHTLRCFERGENLSKIAQMDRDTYSRKDENKVLKGVLKMIDNVINEYSRDDNRISVDTPLGKLYAEIGGERNDYPEIFTYIERFDGVEIDLVAVGTETGSNQMNAYLYGDTATDDWTRKHSWTREDINIEA